MRRSEQVLVSCETKDLENWNRKPGNVNDVRALRGFIKVQPLTLVERRLHRNIIPYRIILFCARNPLASRLCLSSSSLYDRCSYRTISQMAVLHSKPRCIFKVTLGVFCDYAQKLWLHTQHRTGKRGAQERLACVCLAHMKVRRSRRRTVLPPWLERLPSVNPTWLAWVLLGKQAEAAMPVFSWLFCNRVNQWGGAVTAAISLFPAPESQI